MCFNWFHNIFFWKIYITASLTVNKKMKDQIERDIRKELDEKFFSE